MDNKELKRKVFWKYFFCKHRFINFKNPKLFTEKIQWLKVYDCIPIKTRLADKILVRDWIKEQIGEEYLKKIYGVYEKYEDIDFSKLPKEYVIKTNHACKMQTLVIEGGFPKASFKDEFNNYLKINYAYKCGYEMQYDKIKPVIFIEEYIKNTNELFEYLFFCFNGEPRLILFASEKRSPNICCTMFDTKWNNLHFNYGGNLHKENVPPPENLDKMLEIARILSKNFKFVRVDLHNVNGKIYFGEMTFTPSSGYMKFSNPKYDKILGSMLDLSK
ncbi:MAG: hypothetical protein LUH05_00330 [Candidatus Gastranaerophilales bacterium]|nr:hypothetical protein [Candidatus Gastranaerophilales bacterium]